MVEDRWMLRANKRFYRNDCDITTFNVTHSAVRNILELHWDICNTCISLIESVIHWFWFSAPVFEKQPVSKTAEVK